MLSEARKSRIRTALDCECSFQHEKASTIHRIGEQFDIIFSANAYHLYRNKPRLFKSEKQLENHKSLLLVMDWDNHSWFKPVHQAIKLFDNKPVSGESHKSIAKRATDNGFSINSCKAWRWKWWKFYTILMTHTPNNIVSAQ